MSDLSFLADFLSKAGQTISASSHARSQCTRAHFTTSRQTIIESPPRPPGNRSVPRPPTWPASLLSSYSLPIIIIIQQHPYKDARQKRGARAAFRAKLIMPALGDPPKIKMPGLWRVFYKGFNHASASVSRVKMPGNYTQARIIAGFAKQVWSCFREPVLVPDRVRPGKQSVHHLTLATF